MDPTATQTFASSASGGLAEAPPALGLHGPPPGKAEASHPGTALTARAWRLAIPAPPMLLALALLAFVWFPPVRDNIRLVAAFYAVAGALMGWSLLLLGVAKSRGRAFPIEFTAVKSHYVQAAVQFSIMLYWGWFAPRVYPEFPLIFAQILYLYAFDALLSWSRGRTWRAGFGPLPIVISTNLLLWFKHDWYGLQFAMLTTGALAKQFISWNREGRRTHIFNPSAFGQFLFAVALIATGTSKDLTWGREIAASFEVPHMLIVVFLGGLVVQSLFHVTLMTAGAAIALTAVNLIYTSTSGGVFYFVNTNLAAAVFLGMHLLVTDPATSPRTNGGRLLFGLLYGLGAAALYRLLDDFQVPTFWDKLLPVPLLNLCVPFIDRFMRFGFVGRLNRAWETALRPSRMNLIHMSIWASLFLTAKLTDFIDADHPGRHISYWKQKVAEGKPRAAHNLILVAGTEAGLGSGAALNELGLIRMEGKIAEKSNAAAAKYFGKACEANNENGCANVAIQFLFLRERRSDADVDLALDRLEKDCVAGGSSRSCFLSGYAYETGRGRPQDVGRAIELYERAGPADPYAIKGLARIGLTAARGAYDVRGLIPLLAAAGEKGDGESCWYLAYMYQHGVGFKLNPLKARAMMQRGCAMGFEDACRVLQYPQIPPYSNPLISVPGFSSAYGE